MRCLGGELGFIVEIEVTMSTARNTAGNAQATFANNAGTDPVNTIPRLVQIISIPST